MNSVKLLHMKCCFFQFLKKLWPPQEKVEMTPLDRTGVVIYSIIGLTYMICTKMNGFKLDFSKPSCRWEGVLRASSH